MDYVTIFNCLPHNKKEVRALLAWPRLDGGRPQEELAMVLMLGVKRLRSTTGFIATVSSLTELVVIMLLCSV